MARAHDKFQQLGARLVAVSADPADKARSLAHGIESPFPLLSDPDLRAIGAYNLRQKGRRIATPAVFVIRPDGTIASRHISGSISERPSVDTLIREVKRARASP